MCKEEGGRGMVGGVSEVMLSTVTCELCKMSKSGINSRVQTGRWA